MSHIRLIPCFFRRVICLAALSALCTTNLVSAVAEDSTEESIALYADAANFQTSGAIELAIQNWKQFLKRYPNDDLASKAAHYLGVCYMQNETPDYSAAADAFAVALKDRKYELREESLANQGWCYYASAGNGPSRDEARLKQSIKAFDTLRNENPKSQYLDRAYFYGGEAAYGLGERQRAIAFYDRFLKLPNAEQSPLHCEAIYAKGIAHEELKQTKDAIAAYRKLLAACGDKPIVIDVHL
ncbi:MAG: tetratricopeptide repeat protein, partial [Planctomycetota bacterium]